MNYSEAMNLLRAWRASAKVSQAKLAEIFGIKQPAVAIWETRGRPQLANALALQALTHGAVPATAWGYSEERIAQVLSAASTSVAPTPHAGTEAHSPADSMAVQVSLPSNDRVESEL